MRFMLLAFVLQPLVALSAADRPSEPIRIYCEYTHTWSVNTGDSGTTSGEIFFSIPPPSSDGSTIITISGSSQGEFAGIVSDEQITGTGFQGDEGLSIETKYTINRYTGKLEERFIVNGKLNLIHYADCERMTEKKF